MPAKPIAKRGRGRPFEKGNRANPGGRPKIPEWFKEHTAEAQKKLLYWLNSKDAKASMQAATLILAYSLGKPTEYHEVGGTLGQLLDGTWEKPA